ncbi:hypothetical protein [Stratiformator vulcanicus]|nr:hypothetical protein [Stratiformator vulcanicus]
MHCSTALLFGMANYLQIQSWVWSPEVIAAIALLLTAALMPKWMTRQFRRAGSSLTQIGRRPLLSLAAVGMLSFSMDLIFASIVAWPAPSFHDEFCYVLQGDTFAQGRMTNPPLEHWENFETFYVLTHPTRQAKYPPLQGCFLALGQVVTGEQIVGVWLSRALAAAAILWMLQAWTTRKWAIAGTLLFILNDRLIMWWGQTYWGGAIAALGGALVYGATIRLVKRPRWSHGVLLGLGLVTLANSRPIEGLISVIPAGVWLGMTLFDTKIDRRKFLVRFSLGALVIIAPAAILMAEYNRQVTGDPLTHPYVAQASQTGWNVIQSILPKSLRFVAAGAKPREEVKSPFREWVAASGRWGRGDSNIIGVRLFKLNNRQRAFYLSLPLALSLLGLPWALKRRKNAFAFVGTAFVICFVVWHGAGGFPHYSAPATPLILVLIVESLRRLSASRIGPFRTRLRSVGELTIPVTIAMFVLNLIFIWPQNAPGLGALSKVKAEIESKLSSRPGKDMVLIQYANFPYHIVDMEWVYNQADIDKADVIWARSVGSVEDAQLLRDYADRRNLWIAGVRNRTMLRIARVPAESIDQAIRLLHTSNRGEAIETKRPTSSEPLPK